MGMTKDDGSTIRTLLVDDHFLYRSGLKEALAISGITVVAEAETLTEAQMILNLDGGLDVVVLDVRLPDGDGITFCSETAASTDARWILLTSMVMGEDIVARAREAGIRALIMKGASIEEVVAVIHEVVAGAVLI